MADCSRNALASHASTNKLAHTNMLGLKVRMYFVSMWMKKKDKSKTSSCGVKQHEIVNIQASRPTIGQQL